MTRLADLPPDVRRAIQSGQATTKGSRGVRVAADVPDGRHTWRCHRCGETFKAWAPAERHARSNIHHGRIECVISLLVGSKG